MLLLSSGRRYHQLRHALAELLCRRPRGGAWLAVFAVELRDRYDCVAKSWWQARVWLGKGELRAIDLRILKASK